MNVVHKFLIDPFGKIDIAANAQFLHLDEQDGALCLWALVDTARPKVRRDVQVVGTGKPIDFNVEGYYFVGTTVMQSGFVWHVWVKR